MRKLRSGEIVNYLRSKGSLLYKVCSLGELLSLESSWGEEVGLWGTVVLTPVALTAWSVYLGVVFLNWLGVLNTENLFTALFSNHSTPRPQWQTAKGKQRKRGGGLGLLWESGLPYHRNNSSDANWGPDLLPPKEFYFLHLEFFSDLRNLQPLNLTMFGWTAQRRRLKQHIIKQWLQPYMCGITYEVAITEEGIVMGIWGDKWIPSH